MFYLVDAVSFLPVFSSGKRTKLAEQSFGMRLWLLLQSGGLLRPQAVNQTRLTMLSLITMQFMIAARRTFRLVPTLRYHQRSVKLLISPIPTAKMKTARHLG